MNKVKTPNKKLSSKDETSKLVDYVIALLDESKAEEIIKIDLEGKADFAHYIIVASGRSSRHIASLGDEIASKLKAKGIDNIGIEGKVTGDWVLIDAHDIIINIFRPEVRKNYEIEKIWQF